MNDFFTFEETLATGRMSGIAAKKEAVRVVEIVCVW